MDDAQLWALIREQSNYGFGWWYSWAVLPATMLSGCVFLLIWYGLTRRPETLSALMRWLAPGTLPFILVLPSYYASVSLMLVLDWLWEAPPQRLQDLSDQSISSIADSLNSLALFGLSGMTLALILGVAMALRIVRGPLSTPQYWPQPVLKQDQSETDITAIIGPPPDEGSSEDLRVIEQRYGVLKVRRGTRKENHYSVFPNAVIGKKRTATIIIPDPIVSGEHASFIVRDGQTLLVDMKSTNGTYIKRQDIERPIRISNSPVPLQHDDTIYLGHPNVNESVEIVFLQPQPSPDALPKQAAHAAMPFAANQEER